MLKKTAGPIAALLPIVFVVLDSQLCVSALVYSEETGYFPVFRAAECGMGLLCAGVAAVLVWLLPRSGAGRTSLSIGAIISFVFCGWLAVSNTVGAYNRALFEFYWQFDPLAYNTDYVIFESALLCGCSLICFLRAQRIPKEDPFME